MGKIETDTIVFPGVPSGDEVIKIIAQQTDTVLLAFSCGKDSIAAWIKIKPFFKRIIPFYCYLVPDLEFVERSLLYYEEFFETPIYRVPNPSLYRMIDSLTFQTPERCKIIEAASFGNFDHAKLRDFICEDFQVPKGTWYASGVRAADSPNRRTAMKTHGPMTKSKKVFYPVWDMKKSALVDVLLQSGVKLPVDYDIFGRSFDGIDYRFLKPIKDNFPDDYQRIVEFFPLAELEIFRSSLKGV